MKRLIIFGAILLVFDLLALPAGLLLSNRVSAAADPQAVIKKFVDQNPGSAVVFRDLAANSSSVANQNTPITAASLYKLFVAQFLFSQKEKGSLNFDQQFTLQDIDDQWAENEADCEYKGSAKQACLNFMWPSKPKPGQKASISECLPKMLSSSDNICGYTFLSEMRKADESSFLQNNGYLSTSLSSSLITSAKDVALLLEKIAEGTFVSQASSQNIYSLMLQQYHRDKIPKGVPAGGETANKTGEIHPPSSVKSHDSAIVKIGGKTYVLAVMTQLNPDDPKTNVAIANLAAELFGGEITAGGSNTTTNCDSPGNNGASEVQSIYRSLQTPFYDGNDTAICCSQSQPGVVDFSGEIKEYPDQVDASLVPELKEIVKTLKPNIAKYQAAASRWGIPWQAIAATHWREGGAGVNKSMVNGRTLPTAAELGGREFLYGSANVNVGGFYQNMDDVPGGDPPRRFYGSSLKDIDYSTWLLIQHGVRNQFNGDAEAFIKAAQTRGLTKDEWIVTWGAYLGDPSAGYGDFGKDKNGRMGAGAIMAYLGGLVEKPPAPSVTSWPGSGDSDYDKVADGVDGGIGSSPGGFGCDDVSSGIVDPSGYAYPVGPLNQSKDMPKEGHTFPYAYDFMRDGGTPVYAVIGGEIVPPSNDGTSDPPYYKDVIGCYRINLKGDDGWSYWYGHLQNVIVTDGEQVEAGEQIAEVASNDLGPVCHGRGPGDSPASHLHLDRGFPPKGRGGGEECCRSDKSFIPLMEALWRNLPK